MWSLRRRATALEGLSSPPCVNIRWRTNIRMLSTVRKAAWLSLAFWWQLSGLYGHQRTNPSERTKPAWPSTEVRGLATCVL